MQYMGGKAKIAKRLVQAIMDDGAPNDQWFEPFMGGGNVLEHAAPRFKLSIGMDAHPDLMMMWQAAAMGCTFPPFVSRELYESHRHERVSPLRGFMGFGASFGGKWYGGYGVSPRDGEVCRASFRSVTRQGVAFQKNEVILLRHLVGDVSPDPGAVVYCDPPYSGTTGYSTGSFNHPKLFETLKRWAADGCHVYLSEYTIPEHIPHKVIWSREKRNVLEKGDNQRIAVEHLYRIKADR